MLELSEKGKGNEQEYKQFLERIIEVVNLYEVEKDNTKLLKWMDVLLQKVADRQNTSKEESNASLMRCESPQEQLQNTTEQSKVLNPTQEINKSEARREEFFKRVKENVSPIKEGPVEEERIEYKAYDWRALIYKNSGLDGRVSNYDRRDTVTQKVDDRIEHRAVEEREGKKNIYRNGNQYLVALTTDELANLIINPNIRSVKQNIGFIVEEEELPYLKVSKNMQMKLEDNRSLVTEIQRDTSHHHEGVSIIEKKVLLPFSNKKPTINELEYKFAQFVCKFEKGLDNRKYNIFNITSDNQELRIEEVIWLATIFSKTEYDFTIEACKNLDNANTIEPRDWHNQNNFGNSSKQLCIVSVKDIGHAESCRILSLDVKNGFCNQENIERFRDYVMKVYDLEGLVEKKEETVKELEWRKKRKLEKYIKDSEKEIQVIERKIANAQQILQQISEFETRLQGKETSLNPCFPGNHDDSGEKEGH